MYHELANEIYSLINPKCCNVCIIFVALELMNFSTEYICMRMHKKCYFGKHFKYRVYKYTCCRILYLQLNGPFTFHLQVTSTVSEKGSRRRACGKYDSFVDVTVHCATPFSSCSEIESRTSPA